MFPASHAGACQSWTFRHETLVRRSGGCGPHFGRCTVHGVESEPTLGALHGNGNGSGGSWLVLPQSSELTRAATPALTASSATVEPLRASRLLVTTVTHRRSGGLSE